MKTVFYNPKYDYNLEVNYSKLISNGWYARLNKILTSEDMSEIMYSVNDMYKKKELYPKKKEIFSIFDKIDLQEMNVCIIDCNPQITERSNGIAFANKNSYNNNYDEHLVNLLNKVNNYTQETEHKIDYTLDDWLSQGVFLYNVALTQLKGASKSQSIKWKPFTEFVLKTINDSTTAMIFLFIGSEIECKPYKDIIDPRRHIVLQNHVLDYDSLNKINEEIDGINGKNYRIKW